MLFFRNDYGQGCIPRILELLQEANLQDCPGYGEDKYTGKARDLILKHIPNHSPDIHFLVGGTISNQTVIRHVLRPYEGVISPDSGHIAQHETGAIEAYGHKVLTVPNNSGKLTPAQVKRVVNESELTYEHMVLPRAAYISNATEFGTVYSRQELEELRKVCDELDLFLIMDGARLGNALTSGVDYDLNDLCGWCDAFSIGGTKNGALFGEAVLINNPKLKPFFRFTEKQSGAMLAKGWLLGLQFIGLFEENAFFENARHANEMARQIQDHAQDLGYPLLMKSETNQIFLDVTQAEYDYLKSRVDFEIWEYWQEYIVIRFVTSWHTSQEEVDYLKVYLDEAKQANPIEEEEEA